MIALSLVMITIILLVSILLGVYFWDIHRDKKKILNIVKPIPIFDDWKKSEKQNKIAEIHPGEKVKVSRIRYGKNYMAIKVLREDLTKGWLIYQKGSVEILDIVA